MQFIVIFYILFSTFRFITRLFSRLAHLKIQELLVPNRKFRATIWTPQTMTQGATYSRWAISLYFWKSVHPNIKNTISMSLLGMSLERYLKQGCSHCGGEPQMLSESQGFSLATAVWEWGACLHFHLEVVSADGNTVSSKTNSGFSPLQLKKQDNIYICCINFVLLF